MISRALVEIFRHPALADSLALRGGTALSKLQLRPPARYSEDIDLVQTMAQPAGPMMNALRAAEALVSQRLVTLLPGDAWKGETADDQ